MRFYINFNVILYNDPYKPNLGHYSAILAAVVSFSNFSSGYT